jgi:phosphopantetheinyl transferase (holo-ACP synthase)
VDAFDKGFQLKEAILKAKEQKKKSFWSDTTTLDDLKKEEIVLQNKTVGEKEEEEQEEEEEEEADSDLDLDVCNKLFDCVCACVS